MCVDFCKYAYQLAVPKGTISYDLLETPIKHAGKTQFHSFFIVTNAALSFHALAPLTSLLS